MTEENKRTDREPVFDDCARFVLPPGKAIKINATLDHRTGETTVEACLGDSDGGDPPKDDSQKGDVKTEDSRSGATNTMCPCNMGC